MLCKEQVAQLRDRVGDFQKLGADLVVIGNGTPEHARWFVEEQGINLPVFTDQQRTTYRALGARRGLARILHPGTFVSAVRALRGGHRQTRTMGDATQLGGVAIVRPDGSMPYLSLSRHPGDHPSPGEVLEALQRAQKSASDR
jgi:hypothetical protein